MLKALRLHGFFPHTWWKKDLRFADLLLRINKASSSNGATEAKTRENPSLVGSWFYLNYYMKKEK